MNICNEREEPALGAARSLPSGGEQSSGRRCIGTPMLPLHRGRDTSGLCAVRISSLLVARSDEALRAAKSMSFDRCRGRPFQYHPPFSWQARFKDRNDRQALKRCGVELLWRLLHSTPRVGSFSSARATTRHGSCRLRSPHRWDSVECSSFFVISGFCIHLGWARQEAQAGGATTDFFAFWRRRIRRLYPPYLVVLGLYLLVH